jgi:hypothetical protein
MSRFKFFTAIPLAATLAGWTVGEIMFSSVSLADDPPSTQQPPPEGGGRHRNDPAWQACRKQADDKGMERGDVRRQFMKDCIKASGAAAPAPAPSI